jgi:UDP-GlcNAc3NAcA epimerase
MNLTCVIGTRPQYIKHAVLHPYLAKHHTVTTIDTGQHYDRELSARFIDELAIPKPEYNLNVGMASDRHHGHQTALMVAGIEDILLCHPTDLALVYGDTNSTLAGTLAASKLGIPVAHVEAGLWSGNLMMPEEINRVMVDTVARLLLCPTESAFWHLHARRHPMQTVRLVGDLMVDLVDIVGQNVDDASDRFTLPDGIGRGDYYLATVHRAENTDDPARLRSIIAALDSLDLPVIFPAHPRVRSALVNRPNGNIRVIDPVGYHEMVWLTKHARKVLTDSGGLQKEAYYLGTPCVTLRNRTEWPETTTGRRNVLAGTNPDTIRRAVGYQVDTSSPPPRFSVGGAGESIADAVDRFLRREEAVV